MVKALTYNPEARVQFLISVFLVGLILAAVHSEPLVSLFQALNLVFQLVCEMGKKASI